MKERKKRIYKSDVREAQAAQTRSHVLECAKKLFQKEGFDRATISQIAELAGVSVPTIYALFKSKRGILEFVIDQALPPDQFSELVDDSMQKHFPEKRLRTTAQLARCIYDAEKGLIDILSTASILAPEFKELEQKREKRRYERQEEYIKKLMKEGSLSQKLSLQQARDILWALTGREIYRMLVVDRGWTSDAYEEWLSDLLITSLLDNNAK